MIDNEKEAEKMIAELKSRSDQISDDVRRAHYLIGIGEIPEAVLAFLDISSATNTIAISILAQAVSGLRDAFLESKEKEKAKP